MGKTNGARIVGAVRDVYYFFAYLQISDGCRYTGNALTHNVHPITWLDGQLRETAILWFAEVPEDVARSSTGLQIIEEAEYGA